MSFSTRARSLGIRRGPTAKTLSSGLGQAEQAGAMVRWQKPLLPMPVDPPRLVELLAHGLGAQLLVCVCLVASGCEHVKEEPGKHDEQQVTAPTVERPAELYLPSDEPRQHALDVRKDEGDPVDGFSFGPAPSGTVPPLLARG